MKHYFHHFLIANLCLYITYLVFGSITVWEIILFLFMTFFPVLDELLYVTSNYLEDLDSREIVNLFIVGEMKQTLKLLHQKRNKFYNLILHNFSIYIALCSFLYLLIIFDLPVFFYAAAGLISHLTLDIINDEYEFQTISKWYWPLLKQT